MPFTSPSALCLTLLLISWISCTSEKVKETAISHYQISIVDSVQIEYLGMLGLMDVDPENERVLMFDMQQGLILLSDFRGNKLMEMRKQGDVKDSYGHFLWAAAKFTQDGSFMLLSHNGLFEFDLDGELIQKTNHSTNPLPGISGKGTADSEMHLHEGRIYFTAVSRNQYTKIEPDFYEEFELLAAFDLENASLNRFLRLEDDAIFKNGMAHEMIEMMPTFTLTKDHFYIVVGTEPTLYQYSAREPYKLVQSYPLPYPEFQVGKGRPHDKVDVNAITSDQSAGRALNLKSYKDQLFLSYLPGYSSADRETYYALRDPDATREFFQSISGKYPPQFMLMDQSAKLLGHWEAPEKLDFRQFLAKGEHFWFLGRFNQNEEEDLVKIYKVEITEEE
jgi:hypothetical protein